jgi:tripartite-type tricarboxylate transporter receptor subunit TctC
MTVDAKRRRLVVATAAAAAGSLAGLPVRAQAWPARPIRILVGFPPGGLTDLYARAYGEHIGQQLGQQVVIENRTGAGGNIAAEAVAKSPPDGHTLLFTIQGTLVQAQALYKKLPYDPDKDFTYISAFNPGHLPFAIHKDVPARNFREFVELARKSPTNLGTFAAGSSPHLIAGQLNKLYGTKIEAVHFRGEAPMWQEVATGRVHAGVGSVLGVLPHVQSGAVRVIAVPTLVRSPKFPDVPTYVEQGFDAPIFKLRGWIGFLGPAGMPPAIVDRLGKLVLEAADTPRVQKLHETFAIPEKPTTPAEFLRLYREEGPVWISIARDLGITLD